MVTRADRICMSEACSGTEKTDVCQLTAIMRIMMVVIIHATTGLCIRSLANLAGSESRPPPPPPPSFITTTTHHDTQLYPIHLCARTSMPAPVHGITPIRCSANHLSRC